MRETCCAPVRLVGAGLCLLCFAAAAAGAEQQSTVERQVEQLRLQNERLQRQMQQQQAVIDRLSRKVSELESAGKRTTSEPEMRTTEMKEDAPGKSGAAFGLGKVSLSGEGGLAYFQSQSKGQFPKAEFRVDEAKLFLDAPVWKDVYFFSEVNIATREEGNLNFRASELYLDFEDVSRLWNQDRQLNLRVGQFYIPFGEEYQVRYAIDNPLISHSLSDFWGVDPGVELYGVFEKLHYAVAVQNGGLDNLNDFNSDKSVTARVWSDPAKWLHLSVSGMRTGDLDTQGDQLSAMWFGNGFFRSLGTNTTTFQADAVEGDVRLRWPRGHFHAAGGYVHYQDNNKPARTQRDVYFYYLEGVQNLTRRFYTAARWSQVLAHKGFPVVGNGDFGAYLFDDARLTTQLWKLSLGLGYRWSENLLFKTEYTLEQGDTVGGGRRNHENLFAAEVAFKF